MVVPVPSLATWDAETLGARCDEVLDVYAEAMGVDRQSARGRRSIVRSHLDRTGLRVRAQCDERGRLVGIAYGYLGAPGQWWHDHVRSALDDDSARRWLDGAFEVCELHLRPAWQGRGLGRALLDALLDRPGADAAVLTTPDVETRARMFYRRHGWLDLARELMFPGDPRPFAVLGKDLRPHA